MRRAELTAHYGGPLQVLKWSAEPDIGGTAVPVSNRCRTLFGGVIAAGLVLSCGGDTTAPKPTYILQINAGANATDSIGVELPQALVVEVRDGNGAVVSGAVVQFTAMPGASAIEVATLRSQIFSGSAGATTNVQGSAEVLVELGSVAGKAGIAIAVPALGLTDTARYTVQHGRPAQFVFGVRDTVVMRGSGWDIGARVLDRAGNQLTADSVSYASLNSDATVTTSGHVTAVAEGRAQVDVQYGTAHDTARASIVPAGVLVGVRQYDGVYLMNLDGSGLRKLTAINDASVFPQWSPDGSRITIYEGNPYGTVSLTSLALDGTRTPLVPAPGSLLRGAGFVRPDMGGLLYFSGPRSGDSVMTVWRMNADGSGLVALGSPSNPQSFTHPAPSPDGKTVLFDFDVQGIMAIDVTTLSVHALGLEGYFPVYSPDGTHIAYAGGTALMIANSDGTNARGLFGSLGTDGMTSPSWSADGKWILGPRPGQGSAALVRVSDGVVLPLAFTAGYGQLALH